MKPSFTTRTQIRQRFRQILNDPNTPSETWIQIVAQASKYFPEWQKVRKRKPRQECLEPSEDEVHAMVLKMEQEKRERKMHY